MSNQHCQGCGADCSDPDDIRKHNEFGDIWSCVNCVEDE